jgi:hypothetical protein
MISIIRPFERRVQLDQEIEYGERIYRTEKNDRARE